MGKLEGAGEIAEKMSLARPRHFTYFDQVNQLVEAREADPDTGFMARLMMLCSLPRKNPGDRFQYRRVNGPYTLILSRTGEYKLPYGSIPRLLLAWVCTEAVQTQSRELSLGTSLAEFMRKIGIYNSGGNPQLRLRNQMQRLFRCTVELSQRNEAGERFIASRIADRGEFWWDPKRPDETVLWESKIRLGEDFFNEIISNPVPLDLNILKALKRSSLGLDLYLWLTYRTFSLKRPLRLSWKALYRQFGANPAKTSDRVTVDNFRRKVLRELKNVKTAWPGLNYETAKGVLVLSPSKPAIPPVE